MQSPAIRFQSTEFSQIALLPAVNVQKLYITYAFVCFISSYAARIILNVYYTYYNAVHVVPLIIGVFRLGRQFDLSAFLAEY